MKNIQFNSSASSCLCYQAHKIRTFHSVTSLDAVSDGVSAALQDLGLRLSRVFELEVQQLLQLLRGPPLTHLFNRGQLLLSQTLYTL